MPREMLENTKVHFSTEVLYFSLHWKAEYIIQRSEGLMSATRNEAQEKNNNKKYKNNVQ